MAKSKIKWLQLLRAYSTVGKFHIKSSRKNPNLHYPSQNFYSFGPWLDTLKLERNPKFQVLGSSGALLFRLFRIRPSGQKMTAAMQKWGLPCVGWFQFLREVFKQWKLNLESFRSWEIQKSYLESQGRWSSRTFLMNQLPWQDLKGSLLGLIFRVKKMQL